jgi:NTE family protein
MSAALNDEKDFSAMANSPASTIPASINGGPKLPGQVVLVMQGGGALGAYQGGVSRNL